MTDPVMDLGAGTDPDPRADVTVDLHAPADIAFDLEGAWPLADASVRGLTANHVVEHLADPGHFFAEAARVLRPDGWLEVRVPLGIAADSDPDHEHQWTWETPAIVVGGFGEQRHWDPSSDLRLTSRDVDVGLRGPLRRFTPVYRLLASHWPAWAAAHADRGELRARYRLEPGGAG